MSAKKPPSRPITETMPTSFLPLAWRVVLAEIEAGRFSLVLAFSGSQHANDLLHSAALITNDCWNNVKGTSKLFAVAENVQTLAGSLGPTIKTFIEAEKPRPASGKAKPSSRPKAEAALAAVKSTEADEALEG